MKELKFTADNLTRHINRAPMENIHVNRMQGRFIVTTRDEQKGRVGDVFFIEGVGYATLLSVIGRYLFECDVWGVHVDEGFDSFDKYAEELSRTYKNGEKPDLHKDFYFVHVLLVLNAGGDEE